MPERIHQPRVPVELRTAWRRADPQIERDAELFWQREKLLAHDMSVADRLTQLCLAGYDGDRLIALSTARIVFMDFLGVKLAMLRIATASESRRNRLGTHLVANSRDLLERWSAENPGEEVMGMGVVTQTRRDPPLESFRGFLRDSRLGFVGWTANNEPMHVGWFEHGRIPTRRRTFTTIESMTPKNG